MDIHVVILAAGKGTRMKSALPKVLHRVAGLPMIEHVLARAAALHPRSTTVVIGHQAEALTAALDEASGPHLCGAGATARDRARAADDGAGAGRHAAGTLVLLSGDVPLLSAETLKTLVDRHETTGAAATVVTAVVDDPHGYGRIVRTGEQIARIVEERDATPAEREIREINSGIYAFALDGLFDARAERSPRRTRSASTTCPISSRSTGSAGRGVETRHRLESRRDSRHQQPHRARGSEPNRATTRRTTELMAAGVTIEDPATTYIDRDVDDRRRHDHPSRRLARRHDDDRRRLRNPQRRRASSTRRSATA